MHNRGGFSEHVHRAKFHREIPGQDRVLPLLVLEVLESLLVLVVRAVEEVVVNESRQRSDDSAAEIFLFAQQRPSVQASQRSEQPEKAGSPSLEQAAQEQLSKEAYQRRAKQHTSQGSREPYRGKASYVDSVAYMYLLYGALTEGYFRNGKEIRETFELFTFLSLLRFFSNEMLVQVRHGRENGDVTRGKKMYSIDE